MPREENWYPGIPMTRPARDAGGITGDCRRKIPLPKKKKAAPDKSQLELAIDVEYMRPILCPECRGLGRLKQRVCFNCRGEGIVANNDSET